MLYLKCPLCKNEYTVVLNKYKQNVLYCTNCGWTNVKRPPNSLWFGERRWDRVKSGLDAWLKRVFIGNGFPVEALKGYASMRDGIFLANGTRPDGRLIVEYRANHDKRCKNNKKPYWLKCDSTGKPRSSMTYFHAWLHNEHRDTVFVCDSPRTAIRVMEAWWQAEGRLPDISWSSRSCPSVKIRTADKTFMDRHVICIGSKSLLKTCLARKIKVNAWMETPNGMLPDELYLTCRELEEKANDTRSNSDPQQLQVVVRRQDSSRLGPELRKKCKKTKLRKMQEAGGDDDAIHLPVSGTKECPTL